MYNIKIAFILATILLIISCKPTTKGETSHWDANARKATLGKEKYPQFATFFTQLETKGKTVWDEANKETNEEKKAEKMREANGVLDQLLSPLARFESYVETAEKNKKKIFDAKFPKNKLKKIEADIMKGSQRLSSAKSMISDAKPSSYEDAIKLANDAGNEAMEAGKIFENAQKEASK